MPKTRLALLTSHFARELTHRSATTLLRLTRSQDGGHRPWRLPKQRARLKGVLSKVGDPLGLAGVMRGEQPKR